MTTCYSKATRHDRKLRAALKHESVSTLVDVFSSIPRGHRHSDLDQLRYHLRTGEAYGSWLILPADMIPWVALLSDESAAPFSRSRVGNAWVSTEPAVRARDRPDGTRKGECRAPACAGARRPARPRAGAPRRRYSLKYSRICNAMRCVGDVSSGAVQRATSR